MYSYINFTIVYSLQVGLVFTALAAVGWVVFLGGFGYLSAVR